MAVRIYLPSTLAELAVLEESGRLEGPVVAHAVTDAVRAALVGADEEECEYAVMTAAAQSSLSRLGAGDRPVRVVLAADVNACEPADGEDPSLVRVPHEILRRRLAAVHVDDASAEPWVAAALAARGAADEEAAVEVLADHDLGWYAVQEIAEVLARR